MTLRTSNQLFDAYFTADSMAEVFCDQGRLQGMLDFEAALARAQAAAASRRDRKLAPELATRAALDADLARARSNEAVARAELQQRRSEINELQRNLGMEESR